MFIVENYTKTIRMIRGDTLRLQITLNANGAPYEPEAGDSIRFAMKKDYSQTESLLVKNIPTDTLTLHIEPNDTKTLKWGDYVYDIKITFENGDVDTVVSGRLEILPEVE